MRSMMVVKARPTRIVIRMETSNSQPSSPHQQQQQKELYRRSRASAMIILTHHHTEKRKWQNRDKRSSTRLYLVLLRVSNWNVARHPATPRWLQPNDTNKGTRHYRCSADFCKGIFVWCCLVFAFFLCTWIDYRVQQVVPILILIEEYCSEQSIFIGFLVDGESLVWTIDDRSCWGRQGCFRQ